MARHPAHQRRRTHHHPHRLGPPPAPPVPPGRLTRASEQAFLTALAATANVRLAAAAIGVAHTSIYAKRKASPAFAAQMDEALKIGFDRLEAALIAATTAAEDGEGPDAEWLASLEANPIPAMSAAQAIQQLAMHQRLVRNDEPRAIRNRRLPWELRRALLHENFTREKWRREEAQVRAERARARAERYEQTGDWRHENEPAPVILPPLDQVTGWSKADPTKVPYDSSVALFGGWRLKDWKGA